MGSHWFSWRACIYSPGIVLLYKVWLDAWCSVEGASKITSVVLNIHLGNNIYKVAFPVFGKCKKIEQNIKLTI